MEELKVFRDPVYGYIHVEHQVIWDLVNTKEFQRLRKIHQLGGVSYVFHTANHTRFDHSLGTYHIARRMALEVKGLDNLLGPRGQILFYVASLLHDIGHGSFSHAFEEAFGISHEKYTISIILGDTEINRVLRKFDAEMATDVASIINREGRHVLIESLISSQLDSDRLDYLVRDAYFTGATYGEIDVDRIIRMMRIKDNRVVYKASGIHAIEDYLMSRFHMYWQVYFHPVGRSFEIMLNKLYLRIRDLHKAGFRFEGIATKLIEFIENHDDIQKYLRLNDYLIMSMVDELSEKNTDDVLYNLANKLSGRHLFKDVQGPHPNDLYDRMVKNLEAKHVDYRYFLHLDNVKQIVYNDKYSIEKADSIRILDDNGDIVPIHEYSEIVKSLVTAAAKSEIRLFYDPEFININEVIKSNATK
jgi:HD superfamily phosphohydrolase